MPSGPSREAGSARHPCRAVVDSVAVVGRMGFIKGGHLEGWVWRSPSAAGRRGSGACIARQSSAIAPALPCYACQACVARHGLAGSAPLSSYACRSRRDPCPGRPRPPPGARRYPPGVQARPGGPPHPPSGARRYPPGVQARPGGPPHPPPGARRYPPESKPRTEEREQRPPGTDAGRNGPMDAERSEAQNPRAAANPDKARADSAGAVRSRVRSGSARGGRRGHSLPDGRMNRSSAGSLSACGM